MSLTDEVSKLVKSTLLKRAPLSIFLQFVKATFQNSSIICSPLFKFNKYPCSISIIPFLEISCSSTIILEGKRLKFFDKNIRLPPL